MLAGTAAQLSTNASPPSNSCTKTNPLITIMSSVISGKCAGRRDASDNGIMVPTVFSRSSKRLLRQRARLIDVYRHYPSHTTRPAAKRSEEHTSELQSRENLVCRLLLEKKKKTTK